MEYRFTFEDSSSAYLAHHGVKGMKWGVRNADTKAQHTGNRNPNYTDKQRKQDRQFYGKGGERRINKKLNQGEGLRSARNYESDRLNNARKKAQSSASIGRVVGGVAGAAGGFYLARKATNSFLMPHSVRQMLVNDIRLNTAAAVGALAVGSAIGSGLGAKTGTKISMNARGYSSKKARNSTSIKGGATAKTVARLAGDYLLGN